MDITRSSEFIPARRDGGGKVKTGSMVSAYFGTDHADDDDERNEEKHKKSTFSFLSLSIPNLKRDYGFLGSGKSKGFY